MSATLKQLLGNAGAGMDESMGFPPGCRLYDVLAELAQGGVQTLTGRLATPAVEIMNGMILDRDTKLTKLRMAVGTTGTAGSTTCRVLKNGVAITGATLTIANTDADGSKDVTDDLDVDLEAGDLIEIDLSAIPTAGADVTVTAVMSSVVVE